MPARRGRVSEVFRSGQKHDDGGARFRGPEPLAVPARARICLSSAGDSACSCIEGSLAFVARTLCFSQVGKCDRQNADFTH